MPLAPIRGAPPGAPIPDFPIEEPRAKPAEPTATPDSDEQHPIAPVRRRYTPIEIDGDGITLTFRVIPEMPAIARASMTVLIVSDAVGQLGFPDVSNESEDVPYRPTEWVFSDCRCGRRGWYSANRIRDRESRLVVSVRRPSEQHILHRGIIHEGPDLQTMADELLADLGA